MRRTWIWEQPSWPTFSWDAGHVLPALAEARRKQGGLLGAMRVLGHQNQQAAILDAMSSEAMETSSIEGEHLDRDSVVSSVARHLGIPGATPAAFDARTEGVVEMTIDATQRYDLPLTAERLFGWHTRLLSDNKMRAHPILLGAWRTTPMEIVSGPAGRERVHYEAPPPEQVPQEMERFLHWFNDEPREDGLVRCAIAHFWFETIHPFEDGNGRIGRAIADLQLARDERLADRFYSISRQISHERRAYYDALNVASRGTGDLTPWLIWFLGCYSRAITASETIVDQVVQAADFWRRHAGVDMTDRQRSVLTRFLHGFDGKLTAKKWAALAKISADSAQRDIADLLAKGVLVRNAGGSKNTSYSPAFGAIVRRAPP